VHGRLDLLCLPIEQVLRRLVQFTLVGEVGHVSRVLADRAHLTGHLSLVTAEDTVVLRLAQRVQVLSPLRQCIVG
jgi:hypothetical protein